MKAKSIYKYLLIAVGWIFVGLGVIGIFVPLMPTTIFFILAAASFAKSSERFYNWLINHPRFGKFIKDYREKKAMPLKSKIISISMMAIVITTSAFLFTQSIWIRILLFFILISVCIYIISLNTLKDEPSAQEN
ncbi:MAG: DUF454 domain-containing protein [Ignavibacteria bacterium]|nr:DUF454 domain-containing protein [Ignavibacteria bacterium]